jgi:hypothetical protein
MTYALIPGKCLASARGWDRQDSGDARRTTAAEPLAVAFFEKPAVPRVVVRSINLNNLVYAAVEVIL